MENPKKNKKKWKSLELLLLFTILFDSLKNWLLRYESNEKISRNKGWHISFGFDSTKIWRYDFKFISYFYSKMYFQNKSDCKKKWIISTSNLIRIGKKVSRRGVPGNLHVSFTRSLIYRHENISFRVRKIKFSYFNYFNWIKTLLI